MPQAIWTGHLRLSLVTIPVRLFSATAAAKRMTLHQIHEPSGKRVRYQKVAPGVGPVEAEEIVKGFEYTRGRYVLLSDEEIDELKPESRQTIDLSRFVSADDIDPRYCEKPYYMLPDGEAAREGYLTVRRALGNTGRVGIGTFVLRGRGVVAAVGPCGRGLLLETLRHAHEVRSADEIFRQLDEAPVDKEALALAEELIERKAGKFEPETFRDDYYEAMRELVAAKVEEREPVVVEEPRPTAKIIDLKEALKRSVGRPGTARQAAAGKGAAKKAAPKSSRRAAKGASSRAKKSAAKSKSAAKGKSGAKARKSA